MDESHTGLMLFYQYLLVCFILLAASACWWRHILTRRERERPAWQRSLLMLLSVIVLAVVFLPLGLGVYYRFLWSPSQALQAFGNYRCIETFHEDPLIVSGRRVLPMVMEAVRDQDMPNRRYAIGFLGRYPESVSVLKAILSDEGEDVLCRGDSLESICQIDSVAGTRYAQEFCARDDFLGYIARDLFTRGEAACSDRKSYISALVDWPMRTGGI